MMKKLFLLTVFILVFQSCTDDIYVVQEEKENITDPNPIYSEIKGFYLLNEGNMGTNKASLDFFDYETGIYHRNIYAEANPSVVKELGDVGNDIQIYGSKLYAVINVSNKIEVMDVKTTKKITTIELENARYITFHNGKAYVTSYAGPVSLDPNAPLGKVIEIDTANYQITREVAVGYQPDELVVLNNKIYVANSGGYRFPNYDRTVSVIDINSFQEIEKIDVAINLHRIRKDNYGDLYVSSRGDYYDIPSNLFVIDGSTHQIKKTFNIPVTNMTIVNDKLYYYSNEFNYNSFQYTKSYGIIDTQTEEIINDNLVSDPALENIQTPYGIAVNPHTEDIYITDATNYVSLGYVYCFDSNGIFKWKTEGGNIPAHFAFVYNN